MDRRIAVFVVALCALFMFGCAPAEEPAPEQPADAAPAPAAPAPVDPAAAPTPDLSPRPTQAFVPFPTDVNLVPQVILDRLETDQPMLIFFFDPAQRTTDDQRTEIEAVMEDYRGVIDLVTFDVGRFVTTSESGAITLKPGITEDESADKVARLMSAENLNVTATPYIIFVDDQGHITYRFQGFVDRTLIDRETSRATN
ncbi:MAG: hypothetical protein M1617_03555 [Actinobacteria bacterium]|nr:hypothetical protein [Actinomycetota bacterium]MCL5887365.1 hypothetical protein [Actinomycetota bacterium]